MAILLYRGMTGEQRLEIALHLRELSWDVSRESIRGQFPNTTPTEVERKLRQRLMLEQRQHQAEEFEIAEKLWVSRGAMASRDAGGIPAE
jgi:hypothetical protein